MAEEKVAQNAQEEKKEPKQEEKQGVKKEPKQEPKQEVKKEPKQEEKKEEKKEEKSISAEVKAILSSVSKLGREDRAVLGLEIVKNLTVMELSNWVKGMEEEFGVSAAPVAAATAAAGGSAGGAPVEEEKTEFQVVLVSSGAKKIQVIKEVRALTTLGLKEAKDLVDKAPSVLKEDVPKKEAEEIKAKIEAAGGKAEIK